MVKNPPADANEGDARDAGLVPRSGRPLKEEMATHSVFLPGNPMGRRAWQATIYGVSKTWES